VTETGFSTLGMLADHLVQKDFDSITAEITKMSSSNQGFTCLLLF
jgi:hypothetical protein